MAQRQDSVTDQLRDLIDIANREGMYDAADFIRNHLESQAKQQAENNAKFFRCQACGHLEHVGERCGEDIEMYAEYHVEHRTCGCTGR